MSFTQSDGQASSASIINDKEISLQVESVSQSEDNSDDVGELNEPQ